MGARNIADSFDMLIVALCADFDRRDRALSGGNLERSVEMEYRYYNYKIYQAAAEVVGAPEARMYINDIGAPRQALRQYPTQPIKDENPRCSAISPERFT